MAFDRIIAVGLLTQHDLDSLGTRFRRYYPVDETPRFDELIKAIDEADRSLRQNATVKAG